MSLFWSDYNFRLLNVSLQAGFAQNVYDTDLRAHYVARYEATQTFYLQGRP